MIYKVLDVVAINLANIDVIGTINYNLDFLDAYTDAKPWIKETEDARQNRYGNIAYIIAFIGGYVFACIGDIRNVFLIRFKEDDIIQHVPDGEYDGKFYIERLYSGPWIGCKCSIVNGKIQRLHNHGGIDNETFSIPGPTVYKQGNRVFGKVKIKKVKSNNIQIKAGKLDLEESLFQ